MALAIGLGLGVAFGNNSGPNVSGTPIGLLLILTRR